MFLRDALLAFVELSANLFGLFFFGLRALNVVNSALYSRITLFEKFFSFLSSCVNDFASFFVERFGLLVVSFDDGIDFFLLCVDFLSLIFPIAAVARNVEQIFLHIHIVATYDFDGFFTPTLWQTDFASNLDSKRATRVAHRELE